MKIKYRILLGFTLIYIISFYFLIFWTVTEVNTQPKKAMEESLVDISHILASYLEQGLDGEHIHTDQLKTILSTARKREFSAQIYELRKERIELRVLVIDIYGQVVFDSDNDQEVGKDYSNWNDIRKTFEGDYGARTTKIDPEDPGSSVAYVSAPIYRGEKIIGVCSVAKPWGSIHSFTQTTRKKFSIAGILGFFLILVLSYLISSWITNPIIKLTDYAIAIKEGKRVSPPLLGKGEMKTLAIAFERMRESLEGKEYIEKYVQNLTHQLKGPLSSIRGAGRGNPRAGPCRVPRNPCLPAVAGPTRTQTPRGGGPPEFLEWCSVNRAPKTYTWHRDYLKRFRRHVGDTMLVSALRPFHVEQWVRQDIGPSSSANHRRGAMRAVQRAFAWAAKSGLITESPIANLEKPPAERGTVWLLRASSAGCLMFRGRSSKNVLRFMRTGARIQEVPLIEARHFDGTRVVLDLERSKGRRVRRVIELTEEAEEKRPPVGSLIQPGHCSVIHAANGGPPTPSAFGCNVPARRPGLTVWCSRPSATRSPRTPSSPALTR